MKKLSLSLLSLAFLLPMMISCNTQKGDYSVNSNGLKYRFYVQNEGATPKLNDLVEADFSCTINDTTIIIPIVHDVLPLMEPLFAGDIFEGLAMMHIGDSASFIVRTDSTFMTFFGQKAIPDQFSVDDVMRFDVKVHDFSSESEYMEKKTSAAEKELNEYLAANNITTEPTASGLYYVKTQDGDGVNPQVGDTVKVHYVGKLLDGTQFDSSVDRGEPIEFPLGVGYVIPGWDEGLQLMSKGEKGTLYIPYTLGYGNRGAGPIPPFATLIFEVELIDF